MAWFNRALQEFAQAVGAGANKQVLWVIYGAGWHQAQQLVVPQGIHLEFLPPYSPELQPAEHLWQLSDEPLANRKFESLDALEETLASRCNILAAMPEVICQHTLFHWWRGHKIVSPYYSDSVSVMDVTILDRLGRLIKG